MSKISSKYLDVVLNALITSVCLSSERDRKNPSYEGSSISLYHVLAYLLACEDAFGNVLTFSESYAYVKSALDYLTTNNLYPAAGQLLVIETQDYLERTLTDYQMQIHSFLP